MKNIKNIDRLFQEKFKDFEVEPAIEVWDKIELALREKKNKKRIIPFWYKLAGIAAGLAIAFFVFNNNYEIQRKNNSVVNENSKLDNSAGNNNDKTGNPITVENDVKDKNLKKYKTLQSTENQIVSEENINKKSENRVDDKNANNVNNAITKDNQLVIEKTKVSEKKSDFKIQNIDKNKVVYNRTSNEKTSRNSVVQPEKKKEFLNRTAQLASANFKHGKSKSKNTQKNKSKADFNFNNSIVENEIVATNQNKNNETIKDDVEVILPANRNNLSKDATEKIQTKKTDSIVIAAKTQNPLEELLKKKESEKKKVISKVNKWQITSNVAPVFFDSSTKDSPIDPALNQNSKSFETNLSLGIGMGYAISKKITIRSGVNRFTMAYSTNDIFFRAAMGTSAMKNMTSANNGAGLEIVSRSAAVEIASANEISPQNISEGVISQRMGYFEVPLEMSYAVVNKKIGIDVIGGFSTLFLTENEISMQSGAMSTTLGTASNLRDVHFSSNIGIGFRYRFWKSFQARLEPTLKYQLNTFTDNSVGFKPYFIGVYSGISFGF